MELTVIQWGTERRVAALSDEGRAERHCPSLSVAWAEPGVAVVLGHTQLGELGVSQRLCIRGAACRLTSQMGCSEQCRAGEEPRNTWELQACDKIRSLGREGRREERTRLRAISPTHHEESVACENGAGVG